MKIDQGIKDLKFDLKEYEYEYTFTYHEGCDRINVDKKDGSDNYIFDMFSYKDENGYLLIDWALPRLIKKGNETKVSPLDPEVWEFIEGCSKEGPMFGNKYTGAWATIDKDSGKVKLLSKGHSPDFDPKEETRRQLKINLRTKVNSQRGCSANTTKIDKAETKARETLRDLISEKEWERYLKKGYLLVKGESGKVYQIFGNHSGKHIRVYENGKCTQELCIHSEGVPDSDHILTCMLLLNNSEEEFVKLCNKHMVPFDYDCSIDNQFENKSLQEVFKTYTRVAKKLKIPDDWIDESDDRYKEQRRVEAEIAQKIKKLGTKRDHTDPEMEEKVNEMFHDILNDPYNETAEEVLCPELFKEKINDRVN